MTKKYDNYKESGVEWLGEIPEHWEVKKLKSVLKFTTGGTPSSHESGLYDGNEPWVTISDIEGRHITKSHFISTKGVKSANIPLTPKGSLLYSFKLSVGQVAFSKINLYTNEAIASFHPTNNVCLDYWYYNLPSFIVKNANTNIYGAYILNQNLIKNATLIVPPLSEQTAIAQFLDDKTTKIDAAIAIKTQQISLLKERKQIVIHKAVTRGLDDSVTLKDSGVEWIGEIPEHWEVKRLKYATEIFRGKFTHRPRNDERMYNGEYPFFQTGDVARAGKYLFIFRQTLNEKGLRVSTLFPKGTIVITIAANIGDISILDIDACFPDSIVGFEPNDFVEKHFLYNSLLIMKEQFMSSTIKNTQMNLNVDRIGSNSIVIPPLSEQKEIADYIETASQKIETAIGLKQQEIEKLQEYKSSLINSVVTGKVRVC